MNEPPKDIRHGTSPRAAGLTHRDVMETDREDVTDEQLVERCRGGNMGAFAQLTVRHQDRLYNVMLRMVGQTEDAQDLTQEAFVRALNGLRRFRGHAGFYTWLFRIGVNLALNHLKRRRPVAFSTLAGPDEDGHQAAGLLEFVDQRGPRPVHQAQVNEMHQRVLAGLGALDEQMRTVVVLRDIEQLDYAQIAQILRVPVGTVKSRLSRARMSLRQQILGPDATDAADRREVAKKHGGS